MEIKSLAIPGVKLVIPKVFGDQRGFFTETYNRRTFAAAGIPDEFVQDNHSLSREHGVVRGLHFQMPPHAQGKLVRVIRGSIFDVAVDIRAGSPSYLLHVSAVLSAENHQQLYVPPGFAHGFATLEPDTEVVYKVTDFYVPAVDRGVLWNDPALGIVWPVTADAAVLSEKDRNAPLLATLPPPFP